MTNTTDTVGPTTVLLIEGDSDLADLMKALLEKVGGEQQYRVLVAEDVTKGLPLVTHADVECVVLDLDSPEGLEDPLSRLRAVDQTTPVIVLSGHSAFDARAQLAMRHGASRYLLKGYIDRNTLKQAIDEAIQAGLSDWRRPLRSMSDPDSDTVGSEMLKASSETVFALVRRLGVPLVALSVRYAKAGRDDMTMVALGEMLALSVRRSDLVARTRQDEYCVLLAGTGDATGVLERIRRSLQTDSTVEGAVDYVEFGAAVLDPVRPQSLDSLMRAARRSAGE